MTNTHPQFLLPLRSHEALLGLLSFGRLLEPLAHFRALAVDLSLLGLLRLKYELLTETVTVVWLKFLRLYGGGRVETYTIFI